MQQNKIEKPQQTENSQQNKIKNLQQKQNPQQKKNLLTKEKSHNDIKSYNIKNLQQNKKLVSNH